jgi:energy coupling factor transporter S component ThiW
MSLGIGTVFSMPGGIPGGIVVGLVYWMLKRSGIKQPELAALTESFGTVFIGGTIAVYLFAPLFGRTMLLVPIWIGWAISSIPGSAMGLIILGALKATGFTRERFRR